MNNLLKKLILSACIILAASFYSSAQETANETKTKRNLPAEMAAEWNHAFTRDGVKDWKFDLTVRHYGGVFAQAPVLTAGIRVDKKRVLGIMSGWGHSYNDAVPGYIYYVPTCLFHRRTFYLPSTDVIGFYSDLYMGANWIAKVSKNEGAVPGSKSGTIYGNPGEARFMAGWQPGVRLTFYKNIHIFAGIVVSTDCVVGFHFGVGF